MAEGISIKLILMLSACIGCIIRINVEGSKPPWEVEDGMSYTDKLKLQNITMELMADANLKIRQTLEIRNKYYYTTAFEVGSIMGKIREKYRHMIEAYRQMKDKYTGRTVNVAPSIRELRPIHFIVTMELVWLIQRQIDKMVNILETTVDITSKVTARRPTGRQNNEGREKVAAKHDEQQLKRRFRERYLMRRLSMPVNSTTTKKRFIDQWPVEDSWNLGPYDDMGNK